MEAKGKSHFATHLQESNSITLSHLDISLGTAYPDQEHFSKQGRVSWSLQRRLDLLAEVQRLAVSIGVPGDVGYSCETAEYFYREHVHPRMLMVQQEFKGKSAEAFPFKEFFNDVLISYSEGIQICCIALDVVEGCR